MQGPLQCGPQPQSHDKHYRPITGNNSALRTSDFYFYVMSLWQYASGMMPTGSVPYMLLTTLNKTSIS